MNDAKIIRDCGQLVNDAKIIRLQEHRKRMEAMRQKQMETESKRPMGCQVTALPILHIKMSSMSRPGRRHTYIAIATCIIPVPPTACPRMFQLCLLATVIAPLPVAARPPRSMVQETEARARRKTPRRKPRG